MFSFNKDGAVFGAGESSSTTAEIDDSAEENDSNNSVVVRSNSYENFDSSVEDDGELKLKNVLRRNSVVI